MYFGGYFDFITSYLIIIIGMNKFTINIGIKYFFLSIHFSSYAEHYIFFYPFIQ